ncbi:RICIN domain-containing protein [Kitasatospora sp. NBC_00458]|uniref:RICIN domain-containing protein n=1 Tax=Kitasatospora sp. NBC_00458 TaxID=2903568 RepID=UPI002E16E3DD
MTTTDHLPAQRTRRTVLGRAAASAVAAAALAVTVQSSPAHAADSAQFRITNLAVGKCLEVADWRIDDGAPIRMWSCTSGNNQDWYWTDRDELVNVRSGKCLDIPGLSTDQGVQAVLWTCNGGRNQAWSDANRLHSGSRTIVNLNSGLNLDVKGANPADGTAVIQWAPNNGYNQAWAYSPFPPGPHN